MLSLKKIQNVFSCFFLLATLISFSGFTSISTNYNKPQTEIVVSTNYIDYNVAKQYKTLAKSYQKALYNQYIVFNFKSLLLSQHLQFDLTYKYQKASVIKYTDYKFLEQNLITQSFSESSESHFIE